MAVHDSDRRRPSPLTADPQRLDTIVADKTHRGQAVIEQVHADLKASARAHLPRRAFTANAVWLVLDVSRSTSPGLPAS